MTTEERTKRLERGYYHFHCDKAYLIEAVRRDGVEAVLGDSFDGTIDDAIEAIREDEREFFTVGSCDNQAPNGRCEGHRGEPDDD